MDPFLFSLVVAWFIARGGVEDTLYAARGKPSPRAAYRAKYGPSGPARVGQALGDRLADRIANPRGPGPVRRYFGDLWADSLTSAGEHRRQARARREARKAGTEVPPRASWMPGWSWPGRKREEPPPEPVHATAEVISEATTPNTGTDSLREDELPDVVDAELVPDPDPVPDERGVPADPPPEPEPTDPDPPASTEIDIPTNDHNDPFGDHTMTANTNTVTVGTVTAAEGSLAAYQAYVQAMHASYTDAVTQLEATAADMTSREYGAEVTGLLSQAAELSSQAAELMTQTSELLRQSEVVGDAYQAAQHTGNKESLLAG